VRVSELLAAVTTTTTSTTTTLVQAAGGQGLNCVSYVWVPLLAALLGAIVGGALSFTGSVWVNRMEVSRTARLRIYNELLPKLRGELHSFVEDIESDKATVLDKDIRYLVQASLVAGRPEYRHAASVEKIWVQNRGVLREATRQDLYQLEQEKRKQIQVPASAATKEIRSSLDALQQVLEQRLKRRFG
jgi:hypothetical protein